MKSAPPGLLDSSGMRGFRNGNTRTPPRHATVNRSILDPGVSSTRDSFRMYILRLQPRVCALRIVCYFQAGMLSP